MNKDIIIIVVVTVVEVIRLIPLVFLDVVGACSGYLTLVGRAIA